MEVTGIASLIAAVTAWVTACIGYLGDYCGAITTSGNEILLLGAVAVPLVGTGVHLLKRLISVKA